MFHTFFFQILTSDSLGKGVKFDGKQFLSSSGTVLYGIALVRVVAPTNLKLPILPYRNKEGRSYLPLCQKCCDTLQSTTCTHSEW